MNYRAGDIDYYAILRVSPEADDETIRQAYRRLAREFHPDLVGEIGAEQMKQINAAYHILSDPRRRREYDVLHGIGRNRYATRPQDPPIRRSYSSVTQSPRPPSPAPPPSPPTSTPSRPLSKSSPTQSEGILRFYRQVGLGEGTVTSTAFAQSDTVAAIGFIDGRIELWNVPASQHLITFDLRNTSGSGGRAGVLQTVRISPHGSLVMAWGLNLGTKIWSTMNAQLLWNSTLNAPSGAMDGILVDTPPMVRFALPSAPLSMAETDPFRWAESGRNGTDILSRPLENGNAASPVWAVPLHCEEPAVPRLPQHGGNRIFLRFLSRDGESLLTFSTGPASPTITNASIFHWWNLRQNTRIGNTGPQRQGSVVLPGRVLWHPIVASSTASLVAAQFEDRVMRIYNVHSGHFMEIPTGAVSSDAQIALSSDGNLIAIATPENRRVTLWSSPTGKQLQQWDISSPVSMLSFTDSKTPSLVIGRKDGVCEIWSSI
jgi:WD40 repeat protein